MMVFLLRFLLIIVSALMLVPRAFAGQCTTTTGSPFNYNFNYTLSSSENYVGYNTGWQQQSSPGSWTASTPCNFKETLYYASTPGLGLSLASTENGVNWYNVSGNEYIQVASQISVWNRKSGTSFYNVPFKNINNGCDGKCTGAAATGSSVKVNFRIKRRFIGNAIINNLNIFNLYANNRSGESTGRPVVTGYLSLIITVPQKCELNAGQIITIDFGPISSSAFKVATKKPDGINPVTRTIAVKCNGIEAQTNLTLRVEADKVAGNIIVSDNDDVGFVIADNAGHELTPNVLSSNIPFKLDDNISANVPIKTYPVSVTGKKPTEGVVTSRAYLRADFD